MYFIMINRDSYYGRNVMTLRSNATLENSKNRKISQIINQSFL